MRTEPIDPVTRAPHGRRAILAALLAAASILLAGCPSPPPPERPKPPPPDYLPAAAAPEEAPPEVAFEEVTESSGVRFRHENGSFGKKFLPETLGSGVCLFDYDGDGLLDIFFVNGARWPGHEKDYAPSAPSAASAALAVPALYRNLGSWKFEDVTAAAGLAVSFQGMGAAAADVDGDGWSDLFVTGVGRNYFFHNRAGKFVDATGAMGLNAPVWTSSAGARSGSWGTSAAFLDYDRDGKLDLFVANYVRWSEETDIWNTLDGVHKAFTSPESYKGDSCRLYRNLGGRFEDVTEKAGVFKADGKALGVAVEDLNGDGWPDLVVSNDTQPNCLFLNERNGSFTEHGVEAGIAYSPEGRARAGMGIDVSCESQPGKLSIAIGNFSKEPIALFREEAPGFFRDDAAPAALASPTFLCLTFGLLFLDYDLDGRLDLAIANGHIEPSIQEVQKEISYRQKPQLFRNRGAGRYGETSAASGPFFGMTLVGRGLAAGDLDGDGDLDLVVTQNGGPAHLLRCDNRTGQRSLRLRLRQPGENRDAIGAVVLLTAGGATERRTVRTGSSYLSQSELTLTFGMGKLPSAEKIEVTWPDGTKESFGNLSAGKSYLIERGKSPVGN